MWENTFNTELFFFFSHNTRTTQWEDPRIQAAAAALSHGNLFSSEHSSVETLFSSPTPTLNSLGSPQNGNVLKQYKFLALSPCLLPQKFSIGTDKMFSYHVVNKFPLFTIGFN